MVPTTFGNSQSAIHLAEILDRQPTFKRKVSAMLQEFNTVNGELLKSNLPDKLKRSFLRTNLERFKTKGANLAVPEVQTFTLNVIKQNYRKIIEQI